jgi:hypothetical protein
VSDVLINASATAGDNDSSWVDLTPNLKSAPQQVDLLGTPSAGCFLAQLGTAGISAGTYQQMRLVLAANTATPANNQCRSAGANCVVLASDLNNPRTLQLSSEATTGIKIPSGQIAGGQFTIAAGQTKSLNIDFDGCASVVVAGNGNFRLKPVLHAGEVSTIASTAITGRLVDANGAPITTGKAIIALEQKDTTNVDRMIQQTTADVNGNFSLCPVPTGTYDLVAVAVTTPGNVLTANGPTLIAGITPGTTLGDVRLTAAGAPASFVGAPMVSSSPTGTPVDFQVSTLQTATVGGAATSVTVPLAPQQSAIAALTTAAGNDCAQNTWCSDATIAVPVANITLGSISNGVITYTPAPTGAVTYKVEAQAFSSGTHTATCTQPVQSTDALTVTAGTNTTITPALAFTGCQ